MLTPRHNATNAPNSCFSYQAQNDRFCKPFRLALAKEWDGWAVAIDELVVDGETVVGLGTYTGTNKATGRSVSTRVAHIWRVQDGKAVKFEQITDTAEVLDAMR